MEKVAVVTGANRGIGFEVCRQLREKGYRVILTARDEAKGTEAAKKLDADFFRVDVSDPKTIASLRKHLEEKVGRLDVLVNNAGILPSGDSERPVFEASLDTIRETFNTNTLGPFEMCRQLIPLMRKQKSGRVINISSGMGQLSEMEGGYPAYRLSKTALNAVTRIFADETEGEGIQVNSVCPGWVKTDMGGAGAERSVEKGAETIVWLATHADGGPTGGFFRDREPIEW